MKIIQVDNFDREAYSDTLIAENVHSYYGPFIVDYLNQKCSGDNSPDYYRLVDDDHKLYVFEP